MIPDSVFQRFPELFTDRLRLRQVRAGDEDDIYSFKSDDLVTAPYCADPYYSKTQASLWIQTLIKSYEEKLSLMWMVTLKDTDRVIGDCCLWHLDPESDCGEVGYELNRAYWKKGLASEAVGAVIEYGFTVMGLNRIEANPFKKNTPSNELLERFGFKLEGRLRERSLFRGEFYDQLYYGLLRKEWKNR